VGVDVWLVIAAAVEEGVEASAANTARPPRSAPSRRNQANPPLMMTANKPRTTAATGRFHRGRDAGAADVDGGSWGTEEATRRRAHRNAA